MSAHCRPGLIRKKASISLYPARMGGCVSCQSIRPRRSVGRPGEGDSPLATRPRNARDRISRDPTQADESQRGSVSMSGHELDGKSTSDERLSDKRPAQFILAEEGYWYYDASLQQWGHLSSLSCVITIKDYVVTAETENGTIKVWKIENSADAQSDKTSRPQNYGMNPPQADGRGATASIALRLVQQLQGHAPDKGILALDGLVLQPHSHADHDDEVHLGREDEYEATNATTCNSRSTTLAAPHSDDFAERNSTSEATDKSSDSWTTHELLLKRGIRMLQRCNSLMDEGERILLASSSMDCTIRIWDILSGKCVRTFFRQQPALSIRMIQVVAPAVPPSIPPHQRGNSILLVWTEQADPRLRVFAFSSLGTSHGIERRRSGSKQRAGSISVPCVSDDTSKTATGTVDQGGCLTGRASTADQRGSIEILAAHSAPILSILTVGGNSSVQASEVHLASTCEAGEVLFWNMTLQVCVRKMTLPNGDFAQSMSSCSDDATTIIIVGNSGNIYIVDTTLARILRIVPPVNSSLGLLNCMCIRNEPVFLSDLPPIARPLFPEGLDFGIFTSVDQVAAAASAGTRRRRSSTIDRANCQAFESIFELPEELHSILTSQVPLPDHTERISSGFRKLTLVLLTSSGVLQRGVFVPHRPPVQMSADVASHVVSQYPGASVSPDICELPEYHQVPLPKPIAIWTSDPEDSALALAAPSRQATVVSWAFYGDEEAIAALRLDRSCLY